MAQISLLPLQLLFNGSIDCLQKFAIHLTTDSPNKNRWLVAMVIQRHKSSQNCTFDRILEKAKFKTAWMFSFCFSQMIRTTRPVDLKVLRHEQRFHWANTERTIEGHKLKEWQRQTRAHEVDRRTHTHAHKHTNPQKDKQLLFLSCEALRGRERLYWKKSCGVFLSKITRAH